LCIEYFAHNACSDDEKRIHETTVERMSNDSTLPKDERRSYKGVFETASRVVKEEGVAAF
jgi:hypothetical protein